MATRIAILLFLWALFLGIERSSTETESDQSKDKSITGFFHDVEKEADLSKNTSKPMNNTAATDDRLSETDEKEADPSKNPSKPMNNTAATDDKLSETDGSSTDQHIVSDSPPSEFDRRYLWLLLLVAVAVGAVVIYRRFQCFKVQHHPGTTDNGTENASFQRTESNKDGVMLLGVKTSGTEENAAAK